MSAGAARGAPTDRDNETARLIGGPSCFMRAEDQAAAGVSPVTALAKLAKN